jgi:hypothetical protein
MRSEGTKVLKRLVGASGFEPETSCAQGSRKKSILLVRLALFYVIVHGFGPNLAVVGPKLDPILCDQADGRQAQPIFGVLKTDNRQLCRPGAPSELGREYLRIIYGPEYLLPENLERLRSCGVSRSRMRLWRARP